MPAIIKPKKVQLSEIDFSDVKINKYGGKSGLILNMAQ